MMAALIPHFVLLAAGDGEETFWIQLLVLAALAAGAGIYTLAKTRAKRFKRQADDELIETVIGHNKAAHPQTPGAPHRDKFIKRRDVKAGMEILDLSFLVRTVENTGSVDSLDIQMRTMCFFELVRRNRLDAVSSEALTVYTLDKKALFDKTIHRNAMTQLASRTPEQNGYPGFVNQPLPGREISNAPQFTRSERGTG